MADLQISINGESQHVAANLSVQQLLEQLGYNCKEIAVAVNQEFVAREEYASRTLAAQDILDVVAPVQGG